MTREQQAAVSSEEHCVAVRGGPGTGKTRVLVERYRHLTKTHPASRVLVVCRDRAAADRFRDHVLPALRGGFDWLPVTTAVGLAHDLVARSSGQPAREVLVGAPQRALVRRLLTDEERQDWPALGKYLGRPAFAEEVMAGLAELGEVGVEVAERAGGHWGELAGFARRYAAAVEEAGRVDVAGLLVEASLVAAEQRDRFDHVLIDDAGALREGGLRLVQALTGNGTDRRGLFFTSDAGVSRAGLPAPMVNYALGTSFRVAAPGILVRCNHPSSEPEAIAGALGEAHRQGVPWAGMAVLVRHLGRRARSIGRALARHGIPVVPAPALAREEPVVRAVVDLLRWVDGEDEALDALVFSPLARLDPFVVRDVRQKAALGGTPLDADPRLAHLVTLRDHLRARLEAGDTPADLAYEAWARGLSHVGQTGLGAVDDRALDGLVSLVDGLATHEARHPSTRLSEVLAALADRALAPEPWRPAASAVAGRGDGVTITSVDASTGREWHTVIVAGCVEGELPRTRLRTPLFDSVLLGRPPVDDEQRLWALATSRATGALLATAAPEPGVLLSRFVEAWRETEPVLPLAPGLPAPARPATAGAVPVWPTGELRLSASQLDTYADCPMRYAYQYVLRARDDPGIHAELGTFVHKVLATFLDPEAEAPAPRSLEGLLGVADRLWSDDIGRYRPQIEEARKDAVAMLQSWWEHEGVSLPDILAVERRFDIEVGPHRLTGSIDRVDRVEGTIRIVDYKTGKREPSAGDVAEDLQLAIYHLAGTRDPELAALGPPTDLQLRYLRSMHQYAQTVTEGHAETTEQRVLAIAERIRAEEFEPSVDANCRTCTFHRLCPLQDAGRQTGVAGTAGAGAAGAVGAGGAAR